jgi:hypothetical protein
MILRHDSSHDTAWARAVFWPSLLARMQLSNYRCISILYGTRVLIVQGDCIGSLKRCNVGFGRQALTSECGCEICLDVSQQWCLTSPNMSKPELSGESHDPVDLVKRGWMGIGLVYFSSSTNELHCYLI